MPSTHERLICTSTGSSRTLSVHTLTLRFLEGELYQSSLSTYEDFTHFPPLPSVLLRTTIYSLLQRPLRFFFKSLTRFR